MSAGLAICLVCGEPLDYFEEAREVSCHICGKKETGHSVCTAGHYVCDVCHREGGVDHVMEYCSSADSKNPVEMAMAMMDESPSSPTGRSTTRSWAPRCSPPTRTPASTSTCPGRLLRCETAR